mmetsp:Transcript_14640/g.47857  ORF Transcript_14640/g.47857 Transcript_14640/m.47857 type:complete len:123 (-) Transcript_14640:408-776(-)
MPLDLASRQELPLEIASGRLTAIGPRETRFEVLLEFDLARTLGFAVPHAPTWLVNLIAYIVAPAIFQRYLTALQGMDDDDDVFASRLRADDTGIYRRVRQATGQPSRHRAGRRRWWRRATRL